MLNQKFAEMAGKQSLKNIKVGHSPLTNSIYIYSHGDDQNVAEEKRLAESEVVAAVIDMVLYRSPENGTTHVRFGESKFELQVRPMTDEEWSEVQNG